MICIHMIIGSNPIVSKFIKNIMNLQRLKKFYLFFTKIDNLDKMIFLTTKSLLLNEIKYCVVWNHFNKNDKNFDMELFFKFLLILNFFTGYSSFLLDKNVFSIHFLVLLRNNILHSFLHNCLNSSLRPLFCCKLVILHHELHFFVPENLIHYFKLQNATFSINKKIGE